MAEEVTITKAGLDLIAQVTAAKSQIVFSSVVLSKHDYQGNDVSNLKKLTDVMQSVTQGWLITIRNTICTQRVLWQK